MESERWQSTTTAEDKKKDDLWADATEVSSSVWSSTSQPVILQAVGLDSPIDVVFLRMKIEEGEPSPSSCGLVGYSYGETVERLLQHMVEELKRQSSVSTGEELFSLGSVWILNSNSKSPIRASILDMERTLDNGDDGMTSLRVHWNPRRYPQATQISECMVHEVSSEEVFECRVPAIWSSRILYFLFHCRIQNSATQSSTNLVGCRRTPWWTMDPKAL